MTLVCCDCVTSVVSAHAHLGMMVVSSSRKDERTRIHGAHGGCFFLDFMNFGFSEGPRHSASYADWIRLSSWRTLSCVRGYWAVDVEIAWAFFGADTTSLT